MELALLKPNEVIPAKEINIFDGTEYIEGPESDEAKERFVIMINIDGKFVRLLIHKSASINMIGSMFCKIFMKHDDKYISVTEPFECHRAMLSGDIRIISPHVFMNCSSANGIFTIKIKDLFFEVFNNTDTLVILRALGDDMVESCACEIDPDDSEKIKFNETHKFYRISTQTTAISEPFTFPRNGADRITITMTCASFKCNISIKHEIIQLRIDIQDL